MRSTFSSTTGRRPPSSIRRWWSLTSLTIPAIVAAFDVAEGSPHRRRPGGGYGHVLAALLEANPTCSGVLFDRPHAIDSAPAIDRCDMETGNLFTAVPEGGDVYLLKSILHDWREKVYPMVPAGGSNDNIILGPEFGEGGR